MSNCAEGKHEVRYLYGVTLGTGTSKTYQCIHCNKELYKFVPNPPESTYLMDESDCDGSRDVPKPEFKVVELKEAAIQTFKVSE